MTFLYFTVLLILRNTESFFFEQAKLIKTNKQKAFFDYSLLKDMRLETEDWQAFKNKSAAAASGSPQSSCNTVLACTFGITCVSQTCFSARSLFKPLLMLNMAPRGHSKRANWWYNTILWLMRLIVSLEVHYSTVDSISYHFLLLKSCLSARMLPMGATNTQALIYFRKTT